MPALKESDKLDSTLAAVVSHPKRASCFSILAERVASPAELSRKLKCPVGTANYHVGKLVELGLVEEVGNRPVRGSTEHFFKAVQRPIIDAQEAAEMSPEELTTFAKEAGQLGVADFDRALQAGTFAARPESHAARTPMQVDEPGWTELTDLYDETLKKTLEIAGNVQNRIAEDPEAEPFPVTTMALVFERPRQ